MPRPPMPVSREPGAPGEPMIQRILPFLSLCLVLISFAGAPAAQDDKSVEQLVTELREKRDQADEALITELARKHTRAAMEGLLEIYDIMESIYMRREVVRALAQFDDVEDAWQPALQKIMDVATEAEDRELRDGAVDALATCRANGKPFLAMIVESGADDGVRVRAMQYHVQNKRPEDTAWYHGFYTPKSVQSDAPERDRDEITPEMKVPHRLTDVRLLAFEAVEKDLSEADMVLAARDFDYRVRDRALAALDVRGFKDVEELAERAYKDSILMSEHVDVGLTGAKILTRIHGADIAEDLMDDAGRKGIPLDLRLGLADLLAGMRDPEVDEGLVKLVGKGKAEDKLFALRAVRDIQDEKGKLDKAIRKGLKDKEVDVQIATMETIAHRGDTEALEDLQKIADKEKDAVLKSAAVDAVSKLRRGDQEWVAQLLVHAQSEDPEIRNAALMQIGKSNLPEHLGQLVNALDHELWSTRLAAARAIEELRIKDGIGPIIARMAKETGRMEAELGDVLWRLTAKPFGKSQKMWELWWQDEGSGFQLVSESELKKQEREVEVQRLKQVTRSSFFGIRIESHRVVFIIDVSGSMEELCRGKYVGAKGEKRMDVAKRELIKCLSGLDKKSFFNIVNFADGVRTWREQISEYTAENLDDAKAYVSKFTAGGGTNLHGAMREAFDDPDVDTIYVLSDGEPTVGDTTDPTRIRNEVRAWTKHRNVVIHAIAVGGNLRILEWLAADTGGSYVHFP